MELDDDKIDDAVLALLRLTLHDERRAWKGFDWQVLDRLHRKGLIADPVGKAKSVLLTEEGLQRSGELLAALFGKKNKGCERDLQACDRPRLGHATVTQGPPC